MTGEKRGCKYFNAFIVNVMLVGYLTFEIHAAGNYHKVKNIQGMLQSGFSLSVRDSDRPRTIQYDTMWSLVIV